MELPDYEEAMFPGFNEDMIRNFFDEQPHWIQQDMHQAFRSWVQRNGLGSRLTPQRTPRLLAMLDRIRDELRQEVRPSSEE